MQIIYISNRPQQLVDTLQQVAQFMPFIKKALVCMPDALIQKFTLPAHALPTKIIAESEILDAKELTELPLLDHQRRNYLLRSRLINHAAVDERFILSDDDARPLKNMTEKQYLKNGKYRHYFFYQLNRWNNNQTEFDVGQISSGAVLNYLGLPSLSFASHMPQIIDRELFKESTAFFESYAKDYPLCEWSTYFNYAYAKHQHRFCEPEAYLTLCWPEHPLAWQPFVTPSDYVFENYTPTCYASKGVFSGISQAPEKSARLNIKKIILWRQYTISCLHPEQDNNLLKYVKARTWINKLLKH